MSYFLFQAYREHAKAEGRNREALSPYSLKRLREREGRNQKNSRDRKKGEAGKFLEKVNSNVMKWS